MLHADIVTSLEDIFKHISKTGRNWTKLGTWMGKGEERYCKIFGEIALEATEEGGKISTLFRDENYVPVWSLPLTEFRETLAGIRESMWR